MCDIDSKTLFGAARLDAMQIMDFAAALADGKVIIAHARQVIARIGQLVIVRCKQRLCLKARLIVQVFDDRAGNR